MEQNPQAKQESVVQSEDKRDRVSKTRTLFDAGPVEIFWKNFLAGASRALGGIIFYLIFLFLVGVVFMQIIWPRIQPLLDRFFNITESLQQMQQGIQLPSNLQLPDNFLK